VHDVATDIDGGAERFVTSDKLFQTADEILGVQLAFENKRSRFVEGAVGFVAKLGAEEDFALLFGDWKITRDWLCDQCGLNRCCSGKL
jgi:hypothetical protein